MRVKGHGKVHMPSKSYHGDINLQNGKTRQADNVQKSVFESNMCLLRYGSERAVDVILRTIGLAGAKVKLGLRNLAYNMERFCTLITQTA